jgi:hypothetical protein
MMMTTSISNNTDTRTDNRALQSRYQVWQLHIDDADRFIAADQHRKARQKLRAALREAWHFGETDERLARTLMSLLAIEVELEDFDLSREQALELTNGTIRVNKACYGNSNPNVAQCLMDVSVLLELHEYYAEANAAAAEAIEIVRHQDKQTTGIENLLCSALLNRACLLWSNDDIYSEAFEALKLAEEAHSIGVKLHGPANKYVQSIESLIDEIKHDPNLRLCPACLSDKDSNDEEDSHDGEYQDEDDDEQLTSGSHITLQEGSVAAQLATAGNSLPDSLRKSILGRGQDVIPELITIIENDELARLDAPGKGFIPIHALEILSDLSAVDSIEPMLKLLLLFDTMDIMHGALVTALASFGTAVVEPALHVHASSQDLVQRESIADVLAKVGFHEPRILAILLEVLHTNVELGSCLLADYGDPAALPALSAALDSCRLDSKGGLFANQQIIEIVAAIEELGGRLTKNQAKLIGQVYRVRDSTRKTLLSFLGASRLR